MNKIRIRELIAELENGLDSDEIQGYEWIFKELRDLLK